MHNLPLQRFLSTYWLEIRLIFGHWSYLLFLTVWSGFILHTYTQNDYQSISGLFNFVLGFIGLIGMFMTGIQTTRTQRTGFDRIEIAFPSGAEVVFARWLASITAVLALVVAPFIVALTAPAGRLDHAYIVKNLLLILISVTFATGLVWTIHTLIGVRRWTFPLFGLLWLAAGMLPVMVQLDNLPIPFAYLINFVTMNQAISTTLWGDLMQGNYTALTALFYVGLALLFAGILLWRTHQQRFYKHLPASLALIAIALVVFLGAGLGYSLSVHNANQQIRAEDAHQSDFNRLATAHMPFQATDYHVQFTLGEPSQLSAQIEVVNRGDAPLETLTFSLYHQFTVTDASVPFTREHDLLTLTLPQTLAPAQSTQISVSYEGNIRYMERRLGRPPEVTYFIDWQGVHLGCPILWYPVAGQLLPNQTSYYDESAQLTRPCLLDAPARFDLTVENTTDNDALRFASNLTQTDATTFKSEGTTWAMLIASPHVVSVASMESAPLTLITSEARTGQLPKIEHHYLPLFRYLQKHFDDVQALTVVGIDLVPDSPSMWSTHPASAETLMTFISPRSLEFMVTGTRDEFDTFGKPLIASYFDHANYDYFLFDNIAYFLWLHYLTDGDAAQIQTILTDGLPVGRVQYYGLTGDRYQVSQKLLDVYVQHGETALFDLLDILYAERAILNTKGLEGVAAWIEARILDDVDAS